MNEELKEILWNQFGAAIDMLNDAISLCPQEMWDTSGKFWYKAYHSLFWLDYYLSVEPGKFRPPSPFTLSELDPSDVMPERTYSKEELLGYLQLCRRKCYDRIYGLTSAVYGEFWNNGRKNYPVLELLLYNLRHVQHHTGQLNLLLRQGIDNAPGWISRAKTE